MLLSDIHIRDPFILPFDGKYYLYGSRGGASINGQRGFDVYVSDDLKTWSAPKTIFAAHDGFWGTTDYWAPEVHYYGGAFYLFASFKSDTHCRGTAILRCDTPYGTFVPHSDGAITPPDWECLDGTLYVSQDGTPYMVFCHEWVQIQNGTVCAVELSRDLKKAIAEPFLLWSAGDAPWVCPPSGAADGNLVTDGPFLVRVDGELVSIWSSFDKNGYVEAVARSDNGEINGNWTIDAQTLCTDDSGHGMIFTDFGGQPYFVCHSPNCAPDERPILQPISWDLLKHG